MYPYRSIHYESEHFMLLASDFWASVCILVFASGYIIHVNINNNSRNTILDMQVEIFFWHQAFEQTSCHPLAMAWPTQSTLVSIVHMRFYACVYLSIFGRTKQCILFRMLRIQIYMSMTMISRCMHIHV